MGLSLQEALSQPRETEVLRSPASKAPLVAGPRDAPPEPALSLPYSVRHADLEDVGDIARIHVAAWRECYSFIPNYIHDARSVAYRQAQWAETIQHMWARKEPVSVLEHLGKIAGFANIKRNEDPDMPMADYELHAAYFAPEHRGTLAGPMMLAGLIDDLQSFRATNFSVWVFANNPMRITYRQAGLKRIKSRDRDLMGAKIPEIGMLADDLPALANLATKMAARLADKSTADRRKRKQRLTQRYSSELAGTLECAA